MIQNFRFRSTIIFFFFTTLYALVGINLYVIQIKHHDFYKKLADQQYHVTITQTPSRGPIFDRTGGHYLAMNKDYIAAFILPTQLTDKKRTLHFLKKHFPHTIKRFAKNKDKHFMFIKRRLSPEEIAIINEEKNPDIFLLSEPGRYYPLASASPLIGLTSIDNKGLLGIELLYNNTLAGKPTTCHLEKDARSGYYYFKKETTVQGDIGHPLQLTIDADLQFLVQEAVQQTVEKFNAKEAAVIIMNPHNGEIVTMISYPYFDPNNAHTASSDNFKNKIITDAHELGSVMKVCAAIAALEEGVVTADELIDCKNSLTTQIDGRIINTVQAHGTIPFTDVIALSNNIGIAIVAKRLGTKLYDHYKQLGFGSKTNIKFPGENTGYLNPVENWSKQSIISLSYGYEVSITLLQLACAFCTIATGHKVIPTLILNSSAPKGADDKKLYSDATLNTIKEILEKTTLYGTARRAAIRGYRVMSKTGTANMLIDGKYNPEKNIYTCAGIVEKDTYQRVIITFVKEAQQKDIYASTVAVPLFESVAERMLIHDTIIS
ncbi:MAG TPA: penicillin-binding protein 2 [Candidatus Babeliales bacterium]|jgi:cell division protein FtsI (penicillin-binding protein 3)|nr:penicillin-binding protein 2 [Candidatus Babeliales bacterium]